MTTADPFRVVADFEAALCDYTGAKYAVTVNSCTAALFLSLLWVAQKRGPMTLEIPARTYVSVPMVAIQAGHRVRFSDFQWADVGMYHIEPTFVVDAAPVLHRDMAQWHTVCVSFHPRKPLGLSTGGGAILHDDPEADEWYRRMRFDGRTAGKNTHEDDITELGYHCYMMPAAAAEGLQRLSVYRPGPVVLDEYHDLREKACFKTHTGVVR